MMNASGLQGRALARLGMACAVMALLAGCQMGEGFQFLGPKPDPEAPAPSDATRTRIVERDVEAPDVFQVTESGLWDGRPSLGGVWVAHPDTKDPERVLIRNTANGKFVIGALFRRERELPGPRLQVSSDAAAALGVLAGAPAQLQVTALRREEVPEVPATAPPAPSAEALAKPTEVKTATLDPVATGAANAIAKAEAKPETTVATAPPAAPQPKPAKPSTLTKPWLQIGIFSIEANANGAAATLKASGMLPVVRKQESKGKVFWRVLVGPASTAAERDALLKQIKAAGFTDSYAVTN
jgi:rare lipoprotein A